MGQVNRAVRRTRGVDVEEVASTTQQRAVNAALLASTAVVVGVLCDISWDASFGVDSFWSPPHIAINLGATAAGAIAFAMVLLAAIGGGAKGVETGMRVPLGFGVMLWAGIAMGGWGLLDSWWSSAYGIYANGWTPPQVLFAVGVSMSLIGLLVAIAARDNRLRPARRSLAACWAIGLLVTFAVGATGPNSLPNLQRSATFYLVACTLYPVLLALAASYRPGTWSATTAAGCYSGLVLSLVWLLPRFAAEPLIGPIYERIDVMMPPQFPLLLVLPALFIDFSSQSRRFGNNATAVIAGAGFTAVFLAVQWTFAAFLLSPAADNGLFAGGGHYWPFYVQIGSERTQFWGAQADPLDAFHIFICFLLAITSVRAGLAAGHWLAALGAEASRTTAKASRTTAKAIRTTAKAIRTTAKAIRTTAKAIRR